MIQLGSGLDSNAIVVVLAIASGAQPARAKTQEDGTNQLAEGGGIHGLEFIFLAVLEVVKVEGTSRQANSLRCLVILQQPLHLKMHERVERRNRSFSNEMDFWGLSNI